MRMELSLFVITAFLMYNTYYDGKFTRLFKMNAKYIKMASYAFGALSLYVFVKKFPNQSKSMFIHANDMIKYMPIDKNTADMITPFLNFTAEKDKFDGGPFSPESGFERNNHNYTNPQREHPSQYQQQYQHQPQNINQRTDASASASQNKHKRSVSETKKKYVAANQNWKCGHCNMQLDHTFEVDHILDLQFGGSNNTDNLVALCRNCHGKKTMRRHIL
jgi:5-methylcytosine-specific restriction endonuclease McrA